MVQPPAPSRAKRPNAGALLVEYRSTNQRSAGRHRGGESQIIMNAQITAEEKDQRVTGSGLGDALHELPQLWSGYPQHDSLPAQNLGMRLPNLLENKGKRKVSLDFCD